MGMTEDKLRSAVQRRYARYAVAEASCCGEAEGYDPAELASLPDEALMSLGCGTPVRFAELRPGETVVDLGSGGGLDVFLAARQVGPSGRVIGVDMTPEMLQRARTNAARTGVSNVEFREGLIEDLPLEAASVDVVISNCVINLAPDKGPVFAEAHRVLRPGGRLVVSDVVARKVLPQELREDPEAWAACIGGAIPEEDYLAAIRDAGFGSVEVLTESAYEDAALRSVTVRAVK